MAEKIKVYNRTPHDVGVMTANGIGMNIRPNTFVYMSDDDIEAIESMSRYDKRPFATGKLVIDEKIAEAVEARVGIEKDTVNHMMSEAEIDKLLKSNANVLKQRMDAISDAELIYAICKRGLELDLNASKLKVLKDKNPTFDFEQAE